jgi:hypothetical protein
VKLHVKVQGYFILTDILHETIFNKSVFTLKEPHPIAFGGYWDNYQPQLKYRNLSIFQMHYSTFRIREVRSTSTESVFQKVFCTSHNWKVL